MIKKASTGLANFGVAKTKPVTDSAAKPARRRAAGETVALTVRLTRDDWARLHALAVSEGSSLQALALAGLSRVMAEHGLPPMTP